MSAPVHLPNKVQGPPGGWRYKVPETGQEFSHLTEQGLIAKLQAHYRANNFNPPPDLSGRIEEFLCEKEPNYCVEWDGQPPITPSKLAVVAFNLAMHGTRRLIGKEKLVSQEQANARALVCTTCSENVPLEGCTNCNLKSFQEIVERVRGKNRTPYDSQLQTCRVCLCALTVKPWLPLSRLKKMMSRAEEEALPPHCWMLQKDG